MTSGTKRKVSAPSKGLKWQNRFTALIVEEELDVAPSLSRNKCQVIVMGDSLLQGTGAPVNSTIHLRQVCCLLGTSIWGAVEELLKLIWL